MPLPAEGLALREGAVTRAVAVGPLAQELKTGAVSRFDFEIPPGAREHESEAELEIEHDILLYRISPQMHFRRKRMAFEAKYPDGPYS